MIESADYERDHISEMKAVRTEGGLRYTGAPPPINGRSRRHVLRTLAATSTIQFVAGCVPGADPKKELVGEVTWLIADWNVETERWFTASFIPAFRQLHPKVQVTMIPAEWGSDLNSKRTTFYASGTGSDLVQAGAAMVVLYALDRLVLPLNDRLVKWKDWGDYYPVTQQTNRFRDQQYGIPSRIDARAMLYRQDFFVRKGLQLPKTWDDMRTAAIALTERSDTDLIRLGYNVQGFNHEKLFAAIWQNSGEILSSDGRKPTFNSAAGVDALQYWNDLFNVVAPANAKLPERPERGNGIAAGTWAADLEPIGVLDDAVKRMIEVLPHIVVRSPLKRTKILVNSFNNWFGIGTQSKLPDVAWDLLTDFNQSTNLLEYNRTFTGIVPRKSLRASGHMADPRYQMTVWLEVVEKYARPQPLVPNFADCWAAINNAIGAVRSGKQTPKDALDSAARQWQLLLDKGYAGA